MNKSYECQILNLIDRYEKNIDTYKKYTLGTYLHFIFIGLVNIKLF